MNFTPNQRDQLIAARTRPARTLNLASLEPGDLSTLTTLGLVTRHGTSTVLTATGQDAATRLAGLLAQETPEQTRARTLAERRQRVAHDRARRTDRRTRRSA